VGDSLWRLGVNYWRGFRVITFGLLRALWKLSTRALELWFIDRQSKREIEQRAKEQIEAALKNKYDTAFEQQWKMILFLAGQVQDAAKRPTLPSRNDTHKEP
jgi:hypothetical protein